MKRPLASLAAALFLAASIATTAAAVGPSAQASVATRASVSAHAIPARPAGVTPDFTCPNPALCLFQENNWSGTPVVYTPSSQGGHWISIAGSLIEPWGSFNDNSGSSVVFDNTTSNQEFCFTAGSRHEESQGTPNVWHAQWLWITYGIGDCSSIPPPHS